MGNEQFRYRAERERIRVSYPDGKVIGFSNVTDTFIAVLRDIGVERFPLSKLELCHLPLSTRKIYPKYKQWIKPLCDRTSANTQSNTDQKYL